MITTSKQRWYGQLLASSLFVSGAITLTGFSALRAPRFANTIIFASGLWASTSQGVVVLTASAPTVAPGSSSSTPVTCYAP